MRLQFSTLPARIKRRAWMAAPLSLAAILLYVPVRECRYDAPDGPIEYVFWPYGLARMFWADLDPDFGRINAELLIWTIAFAVVSITTLVFRKRKRLH